MQKDLLKQIFHRKDIIQMACSSLPPICIINLNLIKNMNRLKISLKILFFFANDDYRLMIRADDHAQKLPR